MGKKNRRVKFNPLTSFFNNCFTLVLGILVLPNPGVSTSMYDLLPCRTYLTAISSIEIAAKLVPKIFKAVVFLLLQPKLQLVLPLFKQTCLIDENKAQFSFSYDEKLTL